MSDTAALLGQIRTACCGDLSPEELEDLWGALETYLSASAWQPIETAPKDGTEIILWQARTTSPIQGRWLKANEYPMREEGWYSAGYDGAVGPVQPTNWQPLPEPPQ